MQDFSTFGISTAWRVAVIACAVSALSRVPLTAQPAPQAGAAVAPSKIVVVPGFWDPRRRPERPDLSRMKAIRFLTDLDYPPFDFAGPDGNPAGFNVDLARIDLRRVQGHMHGPGAPIRYLA